MSTNYSPKIVTDGLVLCLDAANPKSYPGSGTTWFDLSSKKYIFESNNPPSFVIDDLGNKCFEFIGSGKYFDSTTVSPFSGSDFAITVTAVIDQFSFDSYYSVLSQHEQDSTDSMSFLSLDGRLGVDHWSPGGTRLTTPTNTNQIYHVSWVIPNWTNHQTNTLIYLNGNNQSVESYSVDSGAGPLISDVFRIGNWEISRADMDFQGRIYGVQVYNRALTEAEIKQNFNALRGRYGL